MSFFPVLACYGALYRLKEIIPLLKEYFPYGKYHFLFPTKITKNSIGNVIYHICSGFHVLLQKYFYLGQTALNETDLIFHTRR